MASATIFKGFNKPIENKSLILITKDIKEGKYKDDVLKITALAQQGNKAEADRHKKMLPAFTPSGIFDGGRKPGHLRQYSGYIVLDLDKLAPKQLETAFALATTLPYTFCCFRSPSGNGFKILVEVTSTAAQHETAYKQIANHYEQQLGLPIDRSGKDITRLCFVSYDADAYRNINNVKYPVSVDTLPDATATASAITPATANCHLPLKTATVFERQLKFTDKKEVYADGNRNNYIYLLASNCNRAGIPEQETASYCAQHFDLDEVEIKNTVASAYKNHHTEFAQFAQFAPLQDGAADDDDSTPATQPVEDYLKNTPFIADDACAQLPDIMRDGAMAFTDARERDVFLTGALAILSGCLPGVHGIYAGQEVYPNLFAFIVAPAASGKGALKFAKMLGDEYHNTILKTSREQERRYKAEADAHKKQAADKKRSDKTTEEEPVKPPFKVVYIPANSSYAKILWHLEQNDGRGIICETEADTLGNVFKQEWGSYSDMLRKAFHHEKLSSSKKNNNEFIEVDTPALSIALSGTPNQVTGLIASAEDGLFSRFVFYVFKVAQTWKDVSPVPSGINFTGHFRALSKKVFEMAMFLEHSPTEVTLSAAQWALLNSNCGRWLNHIVAFNDEAASSVVKRLGLIIYRMAMIFTAMRKYENGDLTETLQCTDPDFHTALTLSEAYIQHSLLMFNNLPKQKSSTMFTKGDYKQKFFEELPGRFTRAEAIKIGGKYLMSSRNVDDMLSDASNGRLLVKLRPGVYQKA